MNPEATTVFIVSCFDGWEPSSIYGIFASQELADQWCERHRAKLEADDYPEVAYQVDEFPLTTNLETL